MLATVDHLHEVAAGIEHFIEQGLSTMSASMGQQLTDLETKLTADISTLTTAVAGVVTEFAAGLTLPVLWPFEIPVTETKAQRKNICQLGGIR